MFKILCLLVASALLIEAAPTASDIAEAARSGNWDAFNSLLQQYTQNWASGLVSNVENLKPLDGNSHVYGHAVSSYKEWQNDNGKLTESGRGIEVINKDGQITKHEFTP